LEEEIAQAFANVELTLKTAGGKGWSQVRQLFSDQTEKAVDAKKGEKRTLSASDSVCFDAYDRGLIGSRRVP
jgi:hypothetical protein